ncbi:hypothetical protein Kim5_PA00407 (plasmid) [Rhizobium sp. Kim5]|nr:hypothetical protein Kim5_PA00407 [Rhizobium sp. Kim5]
MPSHDKFFQGATTQVPRRRDNRLGPLVGTVELEFYLCREWVSSKQSILRIKWRDPLDEHLDGNQVVDGAPVV